jgi:hypothetical protein
MFLNIDLFNSYRCYGSIYNNIYYIIVDETTITIRIFKLILLTLFQVFNLWDYVHVQDLKCCLCCYLYCCGWDNILFVVRYKKFE